MAQAEARKICKRLHAYMQLSPCRAKVQSVFAHALNMEAPFGLFSLLQGEAHLRPFSCQLPAMQAFTERSCKVGDDVILEPARIVLPAAQWSASVALATDVDLSIEAMLGMFIPTDLHLRLRHVLRVIVQRASAEDLSPLVLPNTAENAFVQLLRPRLHALRDALIAHNLSAAEKVAEGLSGCGVGLTPSSDDLLCGYLFTYAALSAAYGRARARVLETCRVIAAAAAAHTTDLSAAFLLQSGEGLAAEPVFQLLLSLLSDAPYAAVTAHAEEMAGIGATSGVDMLVGVSLAMIHHYGGKPLDSTGN